MMEKRVLFTASTFSHFQNFHTPYLRAFQSRGYEVVAAAGGEPIPLSCADRLLPLPLEKSMASVQNFAAARLLRRELERQPYTLICCHTALAAFFTRLAVLGMKDRPPLVNTVHGYLFDDASPGYRRAVLTAAEKLTAPVTDLLLTMNRWDAQYAESHRLAKRIVSVPGMGVDFDAMPPAGAEQAAALRTSLGFGEDRFLVLYAAEFSSRKSQQVLLHALAALPERFALLLPGSGDRLESCRQLCRSLGLERRVVFPGQVGNMPLWYAAADAVAASSRSEGLPFHVMEAMHFAVPVAASAVKGHTDLITDGENGLLYPYGDSAACARQLLRLASDRALRERLAAQARADVERFSLASAFGPVMAAYDSVLSGENAPIRT